MRAFLLVFLGGGAGSVLRYIVSLGAARIERQYQLGTFPIGTFAVNIAGCFAIGLVMVAVARNLIEEEYRLLLGVGLLGGFTTFSSFAWEALAGAQRGEWKVAMLYVLLSNVIGFAAALLGARLGSVLSPT